MGVTLKGQSAENSIATAVNPQIMKEEVSTLDAVAGFMRTESPIVRQYEKLRWYTDYSPDDPNYNVYDDIPEEHKKDWEMYEGVTTQLGRQLRTGEINQLRTDHARGMELGFIPSLAFGVASDPLVLLPMLGSAKLTSRVMASAAGYAGRTGAVTAGAGLAGAGISEAWLHSLDPTRTGRESAYVALATVAFGGTLGSIVGKMSSKSFARVSGLTEEQMVAVKKGELDPLDDGVGAARVTKLNDDADYGSNLTGGVLQRFFPVLDMLSARVPMVQKMASQMMEHGLLLHRNKRMIEIEGPNGKVERIAQYDETPIAFESKIKYEKKQLQASRQKIYATVELKMKDEGEWKGVGDMMTRLAKALRRGDIEEGGSSAIGAGAKMLRKSQLDVVLKMAQDLGELPDEVLVKFAKSYFPRYWNKEKIDADPQAFRKFVKEKLVKQMPDEDDAEITAIAGEIFDKLMDGWQHKILSEDAVGTTGRLKDRGINIQDLDLEEGDYIRTNAEDVLNAYMEQVLPELIIKREKGGVQRKAEFDEALAKVDEDIKAARAEFEENTKVPREEREALIEELEESYGLLIDAARAKRGNRVSDLRQRAAGEVEDINIEKDEIISPLLEALKRRIRQVKGGYKGVRRKLAKAKKSERKGIEDSFKSDAKVENAKADEAMGEVRLNYRARIKAAKTQKAKEKLRGERNVEVARLEGGKQKSIEKLRTKRSESRAALNKKYGSEFRKISAAETAKIKERTKGLRERIAKESEPFTTRIDNVRKWRNKEVIRIGRDAKKEMKELRGNRGRDAKAARKDTMDKTKLERANYRKAKKQLRRNIRGIKDNFAADRQTHTFQKELKTISDKYDNLIDNAATPRESRSLAAEKKRMMKKMGIIRDALLGNVGYKNSDNSIIVNAGAFARSINYMATLGGMVVSAIPDIGRPIMMYGASAAIRALPAAARRATSWRNIRPEMEDLEVMLSSMEMLTNSRAFALGDSQTLLRNMRKYEGGFTQATMMPLWNDVMKTWAAAAAQHRFGKNILNYDNLKDHERQQLAAAGFSRQDIDDIRVELAEHMDPSEGVLMMQTHLWDDRAVAKKVETILMREIGTTIVTPGIADRPLVMMTSEMGKMMLQFKSFMFAAHTRMLLPMIQRGSTGDINAAWGLTIMPLMGLPVEVLKLALAGDLDRMDDYSAGDWGRAMVDRSGLISYPFMVLQLADRAFMGKGSSLLFDMKEGSRYRYLNWEETLLGPTYGKLVASTKIGQRMLGGENFTAGDLKTLRRMMPYQNIVWLRNFINMFEDNMNDSLPGGARR